MVTNTTSKWVLFWVFCTAFSLPLMSSAQTLISKGAVWQYNDIGVLPAANWNALSYSASGWNSGPAQLGYGDGDEATVVSYGSLSNQKHVTTYFRHEFSVDSTADKQSLTVDLLCDDGALVYLNGTELFRLNMPSGTISNNTFSSSTVSGAAEDTFQSFVVPANALQVGVNVLAVEIHQRSGTSSDISMDLSLDSHSQANPVSIIRGPYLQMGSSDSILVRWRTDLPTASHVLVGSSGDNLTNRYDNPSVTTEHEVLIDNLQANTRYFYAVGDAEALLHEGSADRYFETSPNVGERTFSRIWVIGDAGTANTNARNVYNAYLDYTGDIHTDLWLMLGDNAYNNGTDAEYQRAVFDLYPELLQQTAVWSTLGNHDGYSADSASEYGPYYDIFSFPRQAEVGGVASGTEAYYSFDHANIHFVVLDSYDSDRSVGGDMLNWLEYDLQNTTADWLVAFWHHPPYTKGSHDSDTERGLIDMRENALPILESYGVDLVLSGHSHSYERSMLVDGHYGYSSSFNAQNIVDGGSGRVDGSGAYTKDSGLSTHGGAVYAVAGSSGKISGGSLNHPVMYVSLNELGSMILDVDGLSLDVKFINDQGAVRDYFTLSKTSDLPELGAITGKVWLDDNQNSLLDVGEGNLEGVLLTLLDSNANVVTTQLSSDGGDYQFVGLENGDYAVQVSLDDYSLSPLSLAGNEIEANRFYPATNATGMISVSGDRVTGINAALFSDNPVSRYEVTLRNGEDNYFGTEDTFVMSLGDQYNYGNSTVFVADGSYPSYGRIVGLIKWDLSSLPVNATVVEAKLGFQVYNGTSGRYDIFELLTGWSESSATWRNTQPMSNQGINVALFAPYSNGEYQIPVNQAGLALIQNWLSGAQVNNGVMVIDDNTGDGVFMYSSENNTIGYRPKLYLTLEY